MCRMEIDIMKKTVVFISFFLVFFFLLSGQKEINYTKEEIIHSLTSRFSEAYESTFIVENIKCYQNTNHKNCYFEISDSMNTYIFADSIQINKKNSIEEYLRDNKNDYMIFCDMVNHSETIRPLITSIIDTKFKIFSYLNSKQEANEDNQRYKYGKNTILIALDSTTKIDDKNYLKKAEQIMDVIPILSPTTEIVFMRYKTVDELTNLHLCESYFHGFMGLSLDEKYLIKNANASFVAIFNNQ